MTSGAHSSDILQEVAPESIPHLLEALKKDWPQSLCISQTIKTLCEWKSKDPNLNTHICCPNGSWEKGTVVCITSIRGYRISLYSFEENSTELKQCLQETERIPWDAEHLQFLVIHEKLYDVVIEVIHSKTVGRVIAVNNTSYQVTPEQVSRLQPKCPEDVYVAPLDVSHAQMINDIWPHKTSVSREFVQCALKLGSSNLGVFTKQGSQLAAWVVDADYGVGILTTAEEHRRKGYAKLLLSYMYQSLVEHGKYICLHIVDGNGPSNELFHSMGVEKLNKAYFIMIGH